MNEAVVLTPERILEVTEDVLRRYGLAKATVVDVARALDVSHGSVYRHFPSKASLRQAVAKRWLDRVRRRWSRSPEPRARRPQNWSAGCARCLPPNTRRFATTRKCSPRI
jgi:AcrR family transcriptional regulator